jgi:ABC-type Fe3+-siderophore transport system permease subunit
MLAGWLSGMELAVAGVVLQACRRSTEEAE